MKRCCLVIVLLVVALHGWSWSTTGHRVVAELAWRNLDAATRDKVVAILGPGQTMSYVAPWLDSASRTDEYGFTRTWHYINVDEGEELFNRQSLSYTDALAAMELMRDQLLNDASDAEELEFALKAVIHIIGDLHQPMHTGHSQDLGGNTIRITFLGESTNLHSAWDYSIVNAAHPGWGYRDWADALSLRADADAAEGSLDDWAWESVEEAARIYLLMPSGSIVTAEDMDYWIPVVERQLHHGGVRLAAWLNGLYGESSSARTVTTEAVSLIFYNLQGIPVGNSRPSTPGLYLRSDGCKILVK